MSKFKRLVEEVLSKYSIKENWETDLDWLKATGYEDETYTKYEDWLEDQEYYTKYAIYVTTKSPYGKLYASYDGTWDLDNELQNDPDRGITELWSTIEEAKKALEAYEAASTDENDPRIVLVYSDEEDGIYYEDVKDVYPYEKWVDDNESGYEDRDDLLDR